MIRDSNLLQHATVMGPKTKAYGGASAVAKEEWDALSAKLCGRVLCEKDAAYEEARLQWNLDRLKRPSYVIRCESVSDVEMAVKFCREHSLDVTVACTRKPSRPAVASMLSRHVVCVCVVCPSWSP
uniref:FAD linked oxidase N-terminal domain-containing protein n=1 Tax=Vitrella brassicaformis TaxID=1169539 RepID=A0A7S1KBC6_9ALVE|mmetsp:Transcript_46656/g.116234  ORF Transcript_46656/g.116234 Transcript_46656/m.116234 type:complete len:126 (+) Transcript_46656:3-380(+)